MRRQAKIGVFVAPIVALAIGVWAEFADLGPPLLLAVAVPAMAVTLASAALLTRAAARPLTIVLLGGAIGLVTFSISEGLYLAIHYARGGTLSFESLDSQPAMAVALFGIHVAVGTVAGLGLGAAGALVAWAVGVRRSTASPAA